MILHTLQFRALSDQLFRSPEHYKHVRKEIVKQFAAKICLLTSFRDTYFIEIMPLYEAPKRGRVLICRFNAVNLLQRCYGFSS
ncbi:OVARIAN TUMOR DOMAIN-containing deubiquitinating enzyme 12-like [Gastrolobium bilobum]|uniref:OVARIAN TUMOR DOMAIN-containing deubiquitinating enzyme 12-like n=1 Tax=Gastrolobium bilobum TaxID=150636 RepID=UPI002AB2910B|nr:OVARIAN TUMOR DOMAIN-containing deubiquitinating enzyme 12-like [Gastrolobium bilobum]